MADPKTSVVITAKDETAAGLRSAENALSGFAGRFVSLASPIALAGTGIVAGTAALVATVKSTIDAADGFNDLSQKVGINVRELAGWTLAANQSGTSMEAVARGVKGLSTYMVEHTGRLRAAGITATDTGGAMTQLADVFAAMPDGVEKTALAVQLFGKAGMDMIPMLNMGSKGLAEAQEKADAYGKKMAELAPGADKFNDQFEEMSLHLKTFGLNVTGQVIDPLTNLVKALSDVAAGGARAEGQMAWLADKGHPIARAVMAWSGVFKSMGLGETRSQGYTGPKTAIGLPASAEDSFSSATDAYMAEHEARKRGKKLREDEKSGKASKIARPFDPFGDFEFKFAEMNEKAKRAGFDANDKAAEVEAKRVDDLRKKYIELADPLNKYRVQLDEINQLRASGQLTAAQALEAEWKVGEQMDETARKMMDVKDAGTDTFAALTRAVEGWGNAFTDTLVDMVMGGKAGFTDLANSIVRDLLRIQIQKNITDNLVKKGTGFLDGIFKNGVGSIFGGYGDTAGVAAGVPRYAQGTPWVPNDGLAYLHKGEAVIPAEFNTGGSGGGVVVNATIDARGADASVIPQINAALAALEQRIYRNIPGITSRQQLRNRITPMAA